MRAKCPKPRKGSKSNHRGESAMITREQLFSEYTDWVNNYLTVEKFAEHRGLRVQEAFLLLTLAEICFRDNHPEQ